jgi:hypothetical protein
MLITYVRHGLRGRAEAVVDFFAMNPAEQDAVLDAWSGEQTARMDADAAVKAAERAAIQAYLDTRGG